MNGYLLDTDWAIDYMAAKERTVSAVDSVPDGQRFISIVSVAELYEGVSLSSDPDADLQVLTDFLAGIAILSVDVRTARLFGQRRAALRRRGRLIDGLDLLIAATCLRHDLRLLTNNLAHFERIEGLEIGLGGQQ